LGDGSSQIEEREAPCGIGAWALSRVFITPACCRVQPENALYILARIAANTKSLKVLLRGPIPESALEFRNAIDHEIVGHGLIR
jgi:hypothetical protein